MTATRTKRTASSWCVLCTFLVNIVVEKNKVITYCVHSRYILHTQSLHMTDTFFRGESCAHLELSGSGTIPLSAKMHLYTFMYTVITYYIHMTYKLHSIYT